MNEAETRAEYIDPVLKAAGWGVLEVSHIRREYKVTEGRIQTHGKRGKPLIADYVLIYRNHILAVIEAKAFDKPLTEGVAQAKNYTDKLALRFARTSNGQGFYVIDMQTGKEGKITDFPGPELLWNATFSELNLWRDRFAVIPFEDRGGYFQARYYQTIAVERVLTAIADNQNRLLLTLATGTGKTFIAFQIAWKLFKSRWNLSGEPTRQPRILFLADRNILDESNWRGILDYFTPAVQLGLTATPKRQDNADTYAYFGEPVFIYSLKDGINDGFLTPFRVKQISTDLDDYVYTSDDTVIEGEIEAREREIISKLQAFNVLSIVRWVSCCGFLLSVTI